MSLLTTVRSSTANQLLLGAVLVPAIVVVGITVAVTSSNLRRTEELFTNSAETMLKSIAQQTSMAMGLDKELRATIRSLGRDEYFAGYVLLDSEGQVLMQDPKDVVLPVPAGELLDDVPVEHRDRIILSRRLLFDGETLGRLVLIQDLGLLRSEMARLMLTTGVLAGLLLLGTCALGYRISRRIGRELEDLVGTARRIGERDFDQPRRELPLPLAIDDTTGSTDQPVERVIAESRPLSLHVLLVEDNPVNRMVATALLKKLGCTTDVAIHGREAVERFSSGSYDAILMDVQMPEMNGLEATAAIRELEGAGPRTPIIALTAHAMKSDHDMCLQAGMDDYLTKPIKREILGETLLRWTNRESAGEPLLVGEATPEPSPTS